MIKEFYCFIEHNDCEDETWRFYVPLTTEEHALIKDIVRGDEDEYELQDSPIPEDEVDIIMKHFKGVGDYMPFVNKCSGFRQLDNATFYKGECWILEEK